MKHSIFLFCAALLCWRCSDNTTEQSAMVSDTIPYKMASSSGELLSCVNSLSYGVLSQQSVVINLTIKNQSERVLNIFPSTLVITSPEGIRTPAIATHADTIVMRPGSSAVVSATFLPINSRFLYHYALLRGDIQSGYSIGISGQSDTGSGFGESIVLRTDTALYSESLRQFGYDSRVKPFHITAMAKPSQENGFKTVVLDESQEETVVRDNEILKGGFWIKVVTYHRDDTLHCRLRFVNQSLFPVRVAPDQLTLLAFSKSIKPDLRSTSELIMRKGDRAEVDLKFSVRIASQYEFDFRSIKRLGRGEKALFDDLFSLEELQKP